jgi:aminopeptidase 2
MASTQLEATDARRVFPSFDEPALKARFTITLIADKNLTCLSNMDIASEVSVSEEKMAVTFSQTPAMATYIVAFAVGDLKMIETNSFRVPVRVYATADKNINYGRFGLELASRTLKAFEKIFDIDYPLPKMDLLAVPGGQGAMENWGLVIFGDSYLLVDEKESSAESIRAAGSMVVHELAHQWFGNLVTMDFWDGLWLNESFADWAELYAWETLEPSWGMWYHYPTDGFQSGLLLNSNMASHPIEVPVNKATEVSQVFDGISYDKGCAVIRMISRYLGIEVFVKGVQLYLKRAAYGNSTTLASTAFCTHPSACKYWARMRKTVFFPRKTRLVFYLTRSPCQPLVIRKRPLSRACLRPSTKRPTFSSGSKHWTVLAQFLGHGALRMNQSGNH